MLLAPEEKAPRARCDTCGSPDIVNVCHHCGKCLCDSHTPRAVDLRGRPVSRELDGLELEGELAAVYHAAPSTTTWSMAALSCPTSWLGLASPSSAPL